MKPLQSIAMGLVIVVLNVTVAGFDLIPNPVGWVLVLLGLAHLDRLPHRGAANLLAAIALVASVVLWFPGVAEALGDADPSLAWAASLPEIATVAVICGGLAGLAGASGDPGARAWLRTAATLTIATAALPVLVFTTDVAALGAMLLIGFLTILLAIVLMFRYAARPWATPELDQTTAG